LDEVPVYKKKNHVMPNLKSVSIKNLSIIPNQCTFELESCCNGLVLDIPGNDCSANGIKPHLYTRNNSNAQRFRAYKIDDKTFSIRCKTDKRYVFYVDDSFNKPFVNLKLENSYEDKQRNSWYMEKSGHVVNVNGGYLCVLDMNLDCGGSIVCKKKKTHCESQKWKLNIIK